MKKILSLALTLGAAVMVHAQGTFLPATYASDPNFDHSGGGDVRDATAGNAFAFGSGYQAQYYVGPAGTTDPTALTAVGPQAGFMGASATDPNGAGYWEGVGNAAITVAGTPGGSQVVLQLRAWKGNSASTYAGASVKGASSLLTVTLGNAGSPATPATSITGMPDFVLTTAVPEPATIALGLMGAGALFIRRRK